MNKIILCLSILIGVGFMFGISMVFADEIKQKFIGQDIEIKQYDPIQIKYWSYSSKQWIHKTIAGYNSDEILILQNERIIKLLEKQIEQEE